MSIPVFTPTIKHFIRECRSAIRKENKATTKKSGSIRIAKDEI